MKFPRTVCCILSILLLAGCRSSVMPDPIREFSSDVRITCKGKSFEGRLISNSYADIRLTVTAPEGLNGFTVRCTPEGYLCEIFGKEDLIPEELLPARSCVRLLFDGLRRALYEQHTTRENTDGDYYAAMDGTDTEAVFTADGRLKLLYDDTADFSAVFSQENNNLKIKD